jgi:hypothetical protein
VHEIHERAGRDCTLVIVSIRGAAAPLWSEILLSGSTFRGAAAPLSKSPRRVRSQADETCLGVLSCDDRRPRPCCATSTPAAPTSTVSAPHSALRIPAPGPLNTWSRGNDWKDPCPCPYIHLCSSLPFVSLHFPTPRIHAHRDSSRLPAQARRTNPGHHRHVRVPAELRTSALWHITIGTLTGHAVRPPALNSATKRNDMAIPLPDTC